MTWDCYEMIVGQGRWHIREHVATLSHKHAHFISTHFMSVLPVNETQSDVSNCIFRRRRLRAKKITEKKVKIHYTSVYTYDFSRSFLAFSFLICGQTEKTAENSVGWLSLFMNIYEWTDLVSSMNVKCTDRTQCTAPTQTPTAELSASLSTAIVCERMFHRLRLCLLLCKPIDNHCSRPPQQKMKNSEEKLKLPQKKSGKYSKDPAKRPTKE